MGETWELKFYQKDSGYPLFGNFLTIVERITFNNIDLLFNLFDNKSQCNHDYKYFELNFLKYEEPQNLTSEKQTIELPY